MNQAKKGSGTYFLDDTLVQIRTDNHRNNVIFTAAVWKLLDILSSWEKSNVGHHQDLTLELSAHSPSDSQHMFRNDPKLQHTYPYLADANVQYQYMLQHRHDAINDEFHGFDNGYAMTALRPRGFDSVKMAKRLTQSLDFDSFGVRFKRGQSRDHLPNVRMVTSFLIRRQYYRDICTSALRRLFNESLTNLRDIRHERWRLPDEDDQEKHDWAYGPTKGIPSEHTLASRLPSSLRSLHIFEDFNATIHGSKTSSEPRPSRIHILKGLAISAPGIEHLSVSFLSDAMECLDTDHVFPNLRSIALTSQTHLRPGQSFNELLFKAASAALKMPQLQIMEIWNCGNGYAALFRYESTGTPESSACRLTWRCSWYPAPIQDRVLEAWKNVASTVAGRELALDTHPLPPASYRRYRLILNQLALRNFVLDDISQMQVRGERRKG